MKARISALYTVPNMLTCSRFIMAPVMLWLAWHGYGNAFMFILAIAFISDILDGLAARVMKLSSPFGAMLDTWADLVIYLTIGFGSWWLWPDIVHREDRYLYIILACYLVPATIATVKFDTYTGYHTWLSKAAAATIGLSLFPLFLFDIAWPFRLSVFLYVLAAVEQIALTLILPRLQYDVRSLWHWWWQHHSSKPKK